MQKIEADLIISNAKIYTVDEAFSIVDAIVIKNDRILATGSSKNIQKQYQAKQTISYEGKYIYPGWNDAHCHFSGYGLSLNQVNLMGSKSVEEIIERCKEHAKTHPTTWITGRGWDQNDWEEKSFPSKHMLDKAFPNRPVLLRRVDGHAAWVNSTALKMAKVNMHTKIAGGEIIIQNGEASGVLIDNAIDLVSSIIPDPTEQELSAGLIEAQNNCFSVGLTSVADAGVSKKTVEVIDSLHKKGILKMRINAWLNPSEENFTSYIENGKFHNDYLTLSTLKLYADGALGSRGAKMLSEYSDDPGNKGLFVMEYEKMKELCIRALEHEYQVAIHCIGDAANRRVLQIYAELLEKENDLRWRVEHSQIIHPDDFHLFGDYNIVPSIQTTHATSDMYWAEDRVGAERMKGAYSYQTLLQENDWLPNGSDFPVEYINPLYGFHAAFSRKDRSGFPKEGFRIEEGLSREEALKAMTIWAAKAAFEEEYKGNLVSGKLADFVVCDQDIMELPENKVAELKVFETWSGGKKVYSRASEK